ncbi:MAG TPA: GNAT family N-acetyltransferase [Acidimicrobiia bacterium]|nr:GNAT family N-acetyltransferase [Acidimicrobiia bacterium]
MSYTFSLRPLADLDEEQRSGIKAMKEIVYPPELFSDDPVRSREWLAARWGILVTYENGEVVSYTGIVSVEGTADGEPVRIGGLGGIATHPGHRGRGLAGRSIDIAIEHLADQEADFALLVCRDELVDYYGSLGWRLFPGTTLNRQRGKTEVFTFNRVMVIDVTGPAPDGGTIDVDGPLW